MNQKGFASMIILILISLGIVGYFGYKYYKSTNLPSPTPISNDDWVIGIQINTCCSCPTSIDSSKIGTDGWVLYEKGKNYSGLLPEECKLVDCAPCPEIPDEDISPTQKCVERSSLDCANESELSYECTEKYQDWAKNNCPNWWGDEAVACKDPRPEECTLECIGNPPYICGSDGRDYCSTCGACSNKSVKWYVIRDTPCEEGFPL